MKADSVLYRPYGAGVARFWRVEMRKLLCAQRLPRLHSGPVDRLPRQPGQATVSAVLQSPVLSVRLNVQQRLTFTTSNQ